MTAQQLKNSILQMAVQGKLVPQDPNDEPASVLLERIRTEKEQLIKEKKIKREKNPSVIFKGADNTPYVYIRVSDMTDGGVSTDRLLYVPEDIYPSISKYIINKADVFITVAGTIGRVGKIPDELDGANLTENADRLVLAVVNQDWLIKVLQSGMIQEQIAEATTQVGQPKLAIVRIERFLIPLPPLHEQERIVSAINTTLSIVQKL